MHDDATGRFTSGGDSGFNKPGDKGSSGKITVRGNELGGFNMTEEELRASAAQYYKNNLAGQTVERKDIGTIRFSDGGFEKPKSSSADTRKLKVIPYLPDIIKNGELISSEPDRKGRRNIKAFHVIAHDVQIGKDEPVRVTIREDNNGNLYYDHVIAKEKASGQRSTPATNPEELPTGVSNSIGQEEWVVNLFLEDEE